MKIAHFTKGLSVKHPLAFKAKSSQSRTTEPKPAEADILRLWYLVIYYVNVRIGDRRHSTWLLDLDQ